MACYRPRDGAFPCGNCVGCDLEKSRQWAMRCMHEAAMHEDNCFVTLTYDEEHMPPGRSLDRGAFPLFMKRLRKARYPQKVRYFHAGEYGERTGRPHYHACLFGVDFPDKRAWGTRGQFPVFRSEELEGLWKEGLSEIGSVTFESAAYVARYILKKVRGEAAIDHYCSVDTDSGELFFREPEFATMSRRPGIGARWVERFRRELINTDSVVVNGREVRPPRYYQRVLEQLDPTGAEAVCSRRIRQWLQLTEAEWTARVQWPEKLELRELSAKHNLKQRSLE